MSQALRKLTAVISKSNCIVIFINQLREKVGVMFGNPEVTTGGRALKFYSSVRMDVRRICLLYTSHPIPRFPSSSSTSRSNFVRNGEFSILWIERLNPLGP